MNGGDMKHCNKEMKGYQALVYPYDSGYKCVVCWREFSHLQISRGEVEATNLKQPNER